ncbi:hypothetical protein A8C40_01025 [Ligilactobacillus salivarius]|nr:hypothetical protein A8C40_01025 [Ligilactobacillus salivarius]
MSIFDTKTLDEKLAVKEREMVVFNLSEIALEQIKAAAEIGLNHLTINFNPLWREVTADDVIRYMDCSPYLNEFVTRLRDEDFDVEKADDLSDEIYVSWKDADNFGTTASKMWRTSGENKKSLCVIRGIQTRLHVGIRDRGETSITVSHEELGIDVQYDLVNLMYYDTLSKRVKEHPVYKYIETYEKSFKVTAIQTGMQVTYKGVINCVYSFMVIMRTSLQKTTNQSTN